MNVPISHSENKYVDLMDIHVVGFHVKSQHFSVMNAIIKTNN